MENENKPEQDINETPVDPTPEMPDLTEAAPVAQDVTADVVNITGTANMVTAQTVTCNNGAIGAVKSETVTINVQNGAVGGVKAQHVNLTVDQSAVGGILAQDVTVNGGPVSFVLAKNISGDTRILFDVRAGLLAGIVAGMVITAFKLILGRRR
jgi:hypothetical protein